MLKKIPLWMPGAIFKPLKVKILSGGLHPFQRFQAPALACAAVLLALPLFAKDLGLGELNIDNDETRHAMTGVFFRDLLIDFPLGDPLEYAYRYYAHYPALGLLHWPPLFHLVEGFCFLLLGVSVPAAKMGTLFFAVLLVVYAFRLFHALAGPRPAFFAVLLLASAPSVVLYSRAVMLEIPSVALTVATIYHFHRYFLKKRGSPVPLALFAAAACLTKATVAFLGPLFLAALLLEKRMSMLLSRKVLAAGLIMAVLVGPYYLLAFGLHGFATIKDISEGTLALQDQGTAETLFYYVRCLPEQLGWPLLLAALPAFLAAAFLERKRGPWFMVLWILACWLFFTSIAQKDSRYILYWIPPFVFLAARAAAGLPFGWPRRMGTVLLLAICAWNFFEGIFFQRPYVKGYEEAARRAVALNEGRPLFFQGFLNGNFIFQVRRMDQAKRSIVLRGGKVLVATTIMEEYGLEELARDENDIHAILQRYGVEHVIIEERDLVGLPIYGVLRKTLKGPCFVEEARIPLETNIERYRGMDLVIYRYLKARPLDPETHLFLPMPVLGRDIEVQIGAL